MAKNEKIDGLLKNKDYLVRNSTGIWDHPALQYFEFYPAGYSHLTPTRVPRQTYHKNIFNRAVKDNTDSNDIESLTFPIDVDEHQIILKKDIDNPHDPHALTVFLIVGDKKYDIGHVPKKISEAVDKEYDRISEGRIYRVREKAYNKHYSTKVVIGYDTCRFLGKDTLACERLADIIDELDEE